jgi:hypothetical protein
MKSKAHAIWPPHVTVRKIKCQIGVLKRKKGVRGSGTIKAGQAA